MKAENQVSNSLKTKHQLLTSNNQMANNADLSKKSPNIDDDSDLSITDLEHGDSIISSKNRSNLDEVITIHVKKKQLQVWMSLCDKIDKCSEIIRGICSNHL